MEDIKILEQFAKYNKYYKEIDGRITMTIDLPLKLDLDKAIENLLKRYKELEEENKKYPIKLNDEIYRRVIENAQKEFIPISVIQNKKKYWEQEHHIAGEHLVVQVLQELLDLKE